MTLRDVLPEDLDVLWEQSRDPDARRMAAFVAKDADRAAFDAHWARLLAKPSVRNRTVVVDDAVVNDAVDGRVAGSISCWVEHGMPEVAYWIGREHWGRGVATAALAAFLRDVVPERPVRARAAADNAGSIRVLEKCGFRREAGGRGFAPARGEEIDEVVLVLE